MNTALLVGVLLLVALFRTSSHLAFTCGIAVTMTMVVDGLLAFVVIWKLWQWGPWAAAALVAPFALVDLTFFTANLLKLLEGAWAPLLFGGVIVLMIVTWQRGTRLLSAKTRLSRYRSKCWSTISRKSRRMSCRAPLYF